MISEFQKRQCQSSRYQKHRCLFLVAVVVRLADAWFSPSTANHLIKFACKIRPQFSFMRVCPPRPLDHLALAAWPFSNCFAQIWNSIYSFIFDSFIKTISVEVLMKLTTFSVFCWRETPNWYVKILFKVLSQIFLALEIFGGSGTRPTSFPLLLMGITSLQI